MSNWYVEGESKVTEVAGEEWCECILSISELLLMAAQTCNGTLTSVYLEMWPDSGWFIAYAAEPALNGLLAERAHDEIFKARFPFWASRWHAAMESSDPAEHSEIIRAGAIATIMEVISSVASLSSILFHVFEFDGSEYAVAIKGGQCIDLT